MVCVRVRLSSSQMVAAIVLSCQHSSYNVKQRLSWNQDLITALAAVARPLLAPFMGTDVTKSWCVTLNTVYSPFIYLFFFIVVLAKCLYLPNHTFPTCVCKLCMYLSGFIYKRCQSHHLHKPPDTRSKIRTHTIMTNDLSLFVTDHYLLIICCTIWDYAGPTGPMNSNATDSFYFVSSDGNNRVTNDVTFFSNK